MTAPTWQGIRTTYAFTLGLVAHFVLAIFGKSTPTSEALIGALVGTCVGGLAYSSKLKATNGQVPQDPEDQH